MGWTIELGEFQGGFRIYRKEDEEECFYQQHLTFLKVSGMWQPSEDHEAIEACRLTVSQDGVEVIGGQMIDGLAWDISVEFHYHREPRKFEGLFTDDDLFHINDTLSIVRSNAIPGIGANEPVNLERPCLSWTGKIHNVTMSPIVYEALYHDVCEVYDLPIPEERISVRMVGNKDSR